MSDQKPSFFLLQPSNFVEGGESSTFLGRLLPHPEHPIDDAFPDDPSKYYQKQPSVVTFHNAQQFVDETAKAQAGLDIQPFLTTGASLWFTTRHDLKAQTIRTFRLPNQASVLQRMLSDQDLKDKIQKHLNDGHRLYMVVGFKSCISSTVDEMRSKGWGGMLSVPISQIATVFGGTMNLKGEYSHGATHVEKGSAFEEYIFAVRYREVSKTGNIIRQILRMKSESCELGDCYVYSSGPMVFGPGSSNNARDNEEDQKDGLRSFAEWNELSLDDLNSEDEDEVALAPMTFKPDSDEEDQGIFVA